MEFIHSCIHGPKTNAKLIGSFKQSPKIPKNANGNYTKGTFRSMFALSGRESLVHPYIFICNSALVYSVPYNRTLIAIVPNVV